MIEEIRIPDIGDVEHVEVIEICVEPGAEVATDDALIVIESDKASMEVPAGLAGKVTAITVAIGDEVTAGHLIAKLETTGVATDAAADTHSPSAAPAPAEVQAPPAEPIEAAATAGAATGRELAVRMPDIGEAQDVVIIELAVAAGDEVAADDLLVVVESDKASMEIPAGEAGSIIAVHVEVGQEVAEGTLLVTLRAADQAVAPAQDTASLTAPAATTAEVAASAASPAADAVEPPSVATAGSDTATVATAARVYAGPAVRRLARELGVELDRIDGSGNRGRIVKDDVKAFVKTVMTTERAAPGTTTGSGIPPIPQVDFAKFGPIDIQPMSRIRVAGATNLHRSWLNVPHVTQHEEADVTELEAFRATLKDEARERQVSITPLAFVIKACCYALEMHPIFNASLDAAVKNFIFKKYYNIGFAVDTPAGLVVPVIRDANRLGIWDLSQAIAELAGKAREQKLAMNDLQGGTFSVSSLGAIGGTGFTPLINAPEVAILGIARLMMRPVWDGSEFVPRKMLPLALSYDHRAINGAEAGRFMVTLAELLDDIRRLSL